MGCNFIHLFRKERPDWPVVCLDALSYAGNLANLESCWGNENFRFVKGDICDANCVGEIMGKRIDVVVNFAAESHVDRSILGCQEFIRTNIQGVQVLLEAARRGQVELLVQISTDEVYGSLGPQGAFSESTPLAPNSPYSASKAGADMLVRAYYETYGLNTIITRCSNNYGPYQFPEKLIPLFVTNLLADKKVPVYGDGLNVRDWLFVEDNCTGIDAVYSRGAPGEIYNIGAGNEKTNLEIAKIILHILNKKEDQITFVKDRVGHDFRYSIASEKIRNLGWHPSHSFDDAILKTIEWYVQNEWWWKPLIRNVN